MWKLLPVCLLVGCAATGQQQPNQARIVRQIDLPLEPSTRSADDQPSKRAFQGTRIQGWLDETGAWHIRTEVEHGRLRCGTYEVGIRLGRGNPVCSSVEWLTGVDYATKLLHCNNAARPHVGDSKIYDMANRFEEVTCVRVVVRCEGTC
jgi:hypothetical protein